MDKFIYERTQNSDFPGREAERIEFEIPEDLNIWELKTVFRRMCHALGYVEASILSALGNEDDDFNEEPFVFGSPFISKEERDEFDEIMRKALNRDNDAEGTDNNG